MFSSAFRWFVVLKHCCVAEKGDDVFCVCLFLSVFSCVYVANFLGTALCLNGNTKRAEHTSRGMAKRSGRSNDGKKDELSTAIGDLVFFVFVLGVCCWDENTYCPLRTPLISL